MSRTCERPRRAVFVRSVLALSLVAGWSMPGAAQSTVTCTDPSCASRLKQEFSAAVRRFALGLSDISRDRRAVQSDIESIGRTLDRWDETIRDFETALGPSRTVDGRVALATVYLERHRLDDALRELTAAARDQPARADIHVLMSIAYRHGDRPSEAGRALRTAATLETRDAAMLYEMATSLAKTGLAEAAGTVRARFRESVGVKPGTLDVPGPALRFDDTALPPLAHYAPGFALLTQGAYPDAVVRFHEALATDRLSADAGDAPDALARGRAALRQGELASALTLLDSAVAAAPERAEARRVLGMAAVIDGQGGRGLEQLKAAIRLDAQDERAWMALADLLATVGQFPEAEQLLKGALQAIPGSAQAHLGLGRLYQALGKYVDAARELEAAAAAAPSIGRHALTAMIEETSVALAAFDRAIEANLARIEASPNNAHAHRRLGDAYLQQDRDDEALTEFTAVIALDPRDAAAHGSMAQLHLRAGRYAEAAEASRRALDLEPSRKEAEYSLGTALMRLGRADEGVTHLEAYQRLQAEATATGRRQHELERLKRDASVAIATSDFAKAADLLRRSVEYESTAPTFLALGFALMQTGRHAEAIVELQKAGRLAEDPNVHRYLAEAYGASGRSDESRAEAQRYLQMIEAAKRERLRAMRETP